jgi:hypothetical protein
MYLKGTEYEGVGLIYLAQDMMWWLVLGYTVMKFQGP